MSFPVELTLHDTEDGPRLFRNPAREIELLHAEARRWADVALRPGDNPLADMSGELFDIHADIEMGDAAEVGLVVRGETITYDAKSNALTALGKAPLALTDGHLQLRLLVDRTSIETFADSGRISLTSCFLPSAGENALAIFARGGTARVKSLIVYKLKSSWR
jgi:sucrose-6-phosphate hydrolase SacC (GH32 family)